MLLEHQKHLSLMNKNLTETSEDIQNIPLAHPQIINLNLSNNKLTEYPQCLLQCKTLITLDIRNNPFKNFNQLITAISRYPYIAELYIDFSDQNQVQSLLETISQLILINGQSTKDFISLVDIDDEEIDKISLNSSLPLLNSIFTNIQSCLQKSNDNKVKSNELFNQFQSLINDEATISNSTDADIPNYLIANFALKSQYNILSFLSNKILAYSPMIDENSKDKTTKEVFEGLFRVINALISIITKLSSKIKETEVIMRNQIEIMLQAIKQSPSSNQNEGNGNEKKMIQMHNNDKDFYLTKIDRLEYENKYMIDKLICLSKQITTDTFNHTIDSKGKKSLLNITQSQSRDQSQIGYTTNTLSFINNSISSLSSLPQTNKIGITGAKILSINAINEKIKEIYESKIVYDKRCKENNLPRETMEQHMYSHLNQKYGLRNLVIEWASSIINCIKMYSKNDCDICLFGKIIRNEIEEDARLVMGKVKSTINDLIEYSIKAKTPFISKIDLQKGLQMKIEGMLTQEEWKNILYSVHSKEDAELIERELNQISINGNDNSSNTKRSKIENNKNQDKKMTREQEMSFNKPSDNNCITYKSFIQCVCNYHIQYRTKYLKPFVKLYRRSDEDSDGIVNEEEFKSLIRIVQPNKSNIDKYILKLLNVIDPFNNKRVTFTECVALFSIELIEDKSKNESVSLLDYICLNSNNSNI